MQSMTLPGRKKCEGKRNREKHEEQNKRKERPDQSIEFSE